jgi:excisionase family DNA binding protein
VNRTKSKQTIVRQATAILSAPQDDQLLGVDQAGELTNPSPWTWRRWAYEGKVSSVKLGKRLLIPRSAVNKLILENTRPALSAAE